MAAMVNRRSWRSPQRTGSTVVRVVPTPGGGWDVKEPGSTSQILVHRATQLEAIRTAPMLLSVGGEVQVLDEQGFLVHRLPVASGSRSGKAPWWFVPQWRWRLVLGVCLSLSAALRIPGHLTSWLLVFDVIMLPLGIGYAVAAYLSGRRLRRLTDEAALRIEQAWRDDGGAT